VTVADDQVPCGFEHGHCSVRRQGDLQLRNRKIASIQGSRWKQRRESSSTEHSGKLAEALLFDSS
jgi:hypothetical protein